MADKNIQMTQRNAGNTDWDNLYPKTKAANVNMADGTTVEAKVNAHMADNTKQIPHLGTTTNSGDAYSITTTEVINANEKFTIKFNAASTTAPTLKINTDTACAIKKANGNNAKLYASVYTLFWDGTNFIQLGEGGDYGTAGAAQVVAGYTIGTENGIVDGTATVESLGGGKSAHGEILNNYYCDVSGLSFTPSVVMVESTDRSKRHIFHKALGDLASDDIGDCNPSGTVGFASGYIEWKSDGFKTSMYATVDTNWYAHE